MVALPAQAQDQKCADFKDPLLWKQEFVATYISGLRDGYVRGFFSAWIGAEKESEFAIEIMKWLLTRQGETLTLMVRDACTAGLKDNPEMTLLDAIETLIIENAPDFEKPSAEEEPAASDGHDV